MEDTPDDAGEEIALSRDHGVQPLDAILQQTTVTSHDLVTACPQGLTHKAMTRARKGRRLTPRMKLRITQTLNALLQKRNKDTPSFKMRDLFNY